MSSPAFSSGNAPAQRVPAWKRLGLKLKSGGPSDDQNQGDAAQVSPAAPPPHSASKRKPSSSLPAAEPSAKKARKDGSAPLLRDESTPSKKAKSVTFADKPEEAPATISAKPQRQKQKQKNKPAGDQKTGGTLKALSGPGKQGAVNLEPALQYLRQWHSDRGSWKFNKNHQTKLLEQVFATEKTIPAFDINHFYDYIRDLKGGVRERLRGLAEGIKAQDMEQGAAGFSAPSSSSGKGKDAATAQKQQEYETVIADFLRGDKTPGKRCFEEVEYVLRTADMEMQRRVVKRMRAEMVLNELSDSDETDKGTSSTTGTSTVTNGGDSTAKSADESGGEGNPPASTEKRLRLNDGSQQRVKRRRKTRTAVVEDEETTDDDDTSSSDDSDADSSDTSSSSGSTDDEDDAEENKDDEDTSSSSSSSSSDSSSSGEESGAEVSSDSDDSDD